MMPHPESQAELRTVVMEIADFQQRHGMQAGVFVYISRDGLQRVVSTVDPNDAVVMLESGAKYLNNPYSPEAV